MKKLLYLVLSLGLAVLMLGSCNVVGGSGENEDDNNDKDNECTHSVSEWTAVVAASCKSDGEEKGICSLCGEEVKRSVQATGHRISVVDAKAPTCTAVGWQQYERCSQCDYTTYEEIPMTEHEFGIWENNTATCTKGGFETRKCSGCDKTEQRQTQKTQHKLVSHPAKEPTDTEVGWHAYYECETCDYSTYVEIPATAVHTHTFGEWETLTPADCLEGGKEIRYCISEDCNESEKRDTDPLGHDCDQFPAKAATCTEPGYKAYERCKRAGCGYNNYETVSKLDHIRVKHDAKAPTVDEIGWEEYISCERCGQNLTPYVELPATGLVAEVLPVKGGAGGIVSIVHDDGNISTVYNLEQIFYKYGIVGTLGLMSENNKTTNNLPKWKEILTTGRWKVASHSATHTWWGIATPDGNGGYTFSDNQTKVYNEIVNSQQALRNMFPGQKVLAFIYPGFATEKREYVGAYAPAMGTDKYNKILEFIYSPESRSLIADTYVVARYDSILSGNEAYVDSVRDFYYMNGGFISNSSYTSGNIKARLDDAAGGGFHLFSLHTCGNGSNDEITPEAMDAVCKMLSEYVAEGKIWNAFYEDAALYVKEAQNATVEIDGDRNGITITLTDTLDNEIYNYPLTVRFSAPTSWQACKIVQGDNVSYAKVKVVDGRAVLDADIIPDGGVATVTAASLTELPEVTPTTPAAPVGPNTTPSTPPTPPTPEEPETPEDGYVSNPNLAIDKYIDFESDPGITVAETATVAFGDRDGKKTLKMVDATSSMGHWTVPFGSSAAAERFVFTFDVNVKSASSGFNTTFYFADAAKTPYMMYLNAASGSYSFGDCQSNSGGAGKTTANLTGSLSYGTWYTVKIDAVVNGADGFKAIWYVKNASGEFVKTGESTNRANYSKSEGAAVQNTVTCFKASSLTGATVEMYFDNLVMQAGTAAGFDKAKPVIDKTFTFDSSTEGLSSGGSVNYSSAAPTTGASNALYVNKATTGYKAGTLSLGTTVTDATAFVLEFDIHVEETNATTATQIVFNSTLSKTPYDLILIGNSEGFKFGDLSNASGGTTKTYSMSTLSYNKTYSIKLDVSLGKTADEFIATLYVDGEVVGTSTNYYKANGTTNPPQTEINAIVFHWQNSSMHKLYLDNLGIKVYDKVITDEDTGNENEGDDDTTGGENTDNTFPADSPVKDGYVSFTGTYDKDFYEGNAHTVKDGKLYTDSPKDWAATIFNYGDYSSRKTYAPGTKYIFEAEYTYLGGNVPTDASGIGFIGFLNAAADTNKHMWISDYVKYGTDSDGDGTPDSVRFFGQTFLLGKTYSLKFIQVCGDSSYDIEVYVDGVKSTYNGNKGTNISITTDNVLYGFGVYYRSQVRIAGYQCCWDNVKVSFDGEELVEEVEFGTTLDNGHTVDVNFFPGHVRKTVSFTLDDGIYQYDKKVVDILKPAGFTGTFNINNPATVSDPTIYAGFEVANHHILHAVAEKADYAAREKVNAYLPSDADTTKVYLASRTVDGEQVEGVYYVYIGGSWHPMASDETYIKYLEWTTKELNEMFGEGTVVGFAYPHGNQYNDAIINYLKEAGYLYGRRTGNLKASTNFALPEDRYTWTYNADHNCLLEVMHAFDKYEDDGELKMFSFGVHAKDFETADKWGDLETFAELYGNRSDDFWYATNREIFEYEDAIKSLVITEQMIMNPSNVTVYIKVDGDPISIEAGGHFVFEELPTDPETPEPTPKPEEPEKAPVIDKSYNFDTQSTEGIKASNTASKMKVEDGTLLLDKNDGYNEYSFNIGGSTTAASKIVLSFDLMLPENDTDATTGVMHHIYFGSKTPYILIINRASNEYYLGDKTKLSGGTQQNHFAMQFGEWYSVKVEILLDGQYLEANWTVTDSLGNERKATSHAFSVISSEVTPDKTVDKLIFGSPKAAVCAAYIDDISIKVYE